MSSQIICEFCDKKFANSSNLRYHLKTAKYCLKIRGTDSPKLIKCKYCDYTFTQKSAGQRHLEGCEMFKAKSEVTKLKREEKKSKALVDAKIKIRLLEKSLKKSTALNMANDFAISEKTDRIIALEKIVDIRDTRILDLEKSLSFERGIIEGLQKTKPPNIISTTNNQYIHPKLKDVPIANILPLDDSVEAYLYKYDYNTFLRATKGAVKVLLDIVIFEDENGIINRNCVCTNRARNSFHILVHDKIWTKDNGAACIHTYLDMLKPLVNTHYAAFNDVMNDLITNGDALDMQLIRKRHNKLTPFRNGILGKPGMEAREKLLIDVRAGIRDQTSI